MIGTKLGPFEITAELGEGGMGVVYRATDSKLKRDVAIKVLPAAFTADEERLARFEREAQLLAQLQHPNIASIYGLEESDGVRALVMELVEGPTLADRLGQGALPLDEALAIARQIAAALEEAHEKGIVHRDLKPQNVKASVDGKVKVLDFGLAKAMDPGAADASSAADRPWSPTLMNSPTMAAAGTQLGVILGTAAYMSPEQARGQTVDKRSDIWAFGVVVWEMLTGAQLFAADTVSDTLAGVLKTEIDLAQLPASTPPAIRRLLRRCLERNPKNRLHDIADARIVIDEVLNAGGEAETAVPAAHSTARRLAPWLLAGAALAVGLGVGLLFSPRTPAPPAEGEAAAFRGQFEISPPDETDLVSGLAISADGRQLAFVARGDDGRTRLWVRSFVSGEARELPGTLGARYPFWAPDGRRLGFFSQYRLKVTDVLAGSPRDIAETGSTEDARGGSWNADDRILFTPSFTGPMFSVAAAGDESPRPATVISPGSGIGTQRFPSFLPDGQRFVYYTSSGTGVEPGKLYLGRLGTLEAKLLGTASSAAVYSEPGYLLYVQRDSLVAHRLDLERDALVGQPIPLGVSLPGSVSVSGQRSLSVSANGILVYRTDKRSGTRLIWVDRQGREIESITTEVDTWHYGPSLSPDGRRLVVGHYEPGTTNGDIWVHDLKRDLATQLTFDSHSDDLVAIWSPDGSEIAYSAARSDGGSFIYRIGSQRPGTPRRWVTSDDFVTPSTWLADGRLIYIAYPPTSGRGSLFLRGPGEDVESRRLGPEHLAELGADLSPDGRWLAFQSDPTRRMEIYLRRLDDMTGASTLRVSLDGGTSPRWRRDGRELFYIDDSGRLMSVPMASLDPPQWSPPVPLFNARLEAGAADRQYDVTADGQRFILNRTLVADRIPIVVVIGWQEVLLRDERR